MPSTQSIPVKELTLDLNNFRTIRQPDEKQAIEALISIGPDYFWGLMESLLDDDYLPTENILVLTNAKNPPILTVKEGNRRIAVLKLIYRYVPGPDSISIPEGLQNKIALLSDEWKTTNSAVPCAVYEPNETTLVDKIIGLAHGKAQKAGRATWTSVAKARYARSLNSLSEPALDLLEKYLNDTPSSQQTTRWAGDYPLTVLAETLDKFFTSFGATTARDLVNAYPSIKNRDRLDNIIFNIGQKTIKFSSIRNKEQFVVQYGLSVENVSNKSRNSMVQDSESSTVGSPPGSTGTSEDTEGSTQPPSDVTMPEEPGEDAKSSSSRIPRATSVYDPKSVTRALRKFKPIAPNRNKVAALRDEALNLDLNRNPLAFCFLLRSIFEISAKAFCEDHKANHGPSATWQNGKDKPLMDVLTEITEYLKANNPSKTAMTRELHCATAELAKPTGLLSVTSMNQLVHNPAFSVTASDISSLFNNIFPLLEALNQ